MCQQAYSDSPGGRVPGVQDGLFIYALGNILNVANLGLILFGVAAGIIIGALPGLSATMGVALPLAFDFWHEA